MGLLPNDLSDMFSCEIVDFCLFLVDRSILGNWVFVILLVRCFVHSWLIIVIQHWYKDEKYSVRVKDEEGCPSFALVNKATGQAIKHADADAKPVRIHYFIYLTLLIILIF